MHEIERKLRENIARKGIETVLDLGKGIIVPKSTARMLKAKKRGCYNQKNTRYCLLCSLGYGSDDCKRFREKKNMKIKLFPSIPEEMGKFYGNMN